MQETNFYMWRTEQLISISKDYLLSLTNINLLLLSAILIVLYRIVSSENPSKNVFHYYFNFGALIAFLAAILVITSICLLAIFYRELIDGVSTLTNFLDSSTDSKTSISKENILKIQQPLANLDWIFWIDMISILLMFSGYSLKNFYVVSLRRIEKGK